MTFAIESVDHVGVRVADSARAEEFYRRFGFEVTLRSRVAPVVVLRNAAGVEVHLVVNASREHDGTNVLMDLPEKRAGITHVALRVASIEASQRALAELGVPLSDGPVVTGEGVSIFVRDPDRNVVEFREARDGS